MPILKFIRNTYNGVALPYEGNQSLIDANPERYTLYYLATEGEESVDPNTGIPLSSVPEPQPAEGATANGGDKDRETRVLDAVMQIDPENYGKPAVGRPSMPKKAAVEYLTGFKVSLDEIEKALALKNALNTDPAADAVEE